MRIERSDRPVQLFSFMGQKLSMAYGGVAGNWFFFGEGHKMMDDIEDYSQGTEQQKRWSRDVA